MNTENKPNLDPLTLRILAAGCNVKALKDAQAPVETQRGAMETLTDLLANNDDAITIFERHQK